jgi:hypothetical protein
LPSKHRKARRQSATSPTRPKYIALTAEAMGSLHGIEAIEESVVVEIKAPAPDIASFFAIGA